MFLYVAIHKDENSVYGVTVPSVEGCFSSGDTLEEAIKNTKEAILFHLEGCLDDGEEPNIKNFTLDELNADQDYAGAQWFGIEVDTAYLTLKPERFNVSWPKYLLTKVDQHISATHDNRSNFLAKAALERINQLS